MMLARKVINEKYIKKTKQNNNILNNIREEILKKLLLAI